MTVMKIKILYILIACLSIASCSSDDVMEDKIKDDIIQTPENIILQPEDDMLYVAREKTMNSAGYVR